MRRRMINTQKWKSRAVSLLALTALSLSSFQPAHAIFGFGDIVIDPTNLVQNISTATNTLRQINNQIRQLQNDARSLINEAKNLTSLDFNIEGELRRVLGEINQLMNTAGAISYQINETERVFQTHFPAEYDDWSNTQIAQNAQVQWEISRAGYEDAILLQSKIVQSVQEDAGLLAGLISESQSAGGNLSAVQAGNQIMALSAKQSMQMQELMASQFRAEALERARVDALERKAKVLHVRFIGSGTAY